MWLGIGKASMYDVQEKNSNIFPNKNNLTSYVIFGQTGSVSKVGCSNRQNQWRDSSTTAFPGSFNKDTPFIYLAFYSYPRNACLKPGAESQEHLVWFWIVCSLEVAGQSCGEGKKININRSRRLTCRRQVNSACETDQASCFLFIFFNFFNFDDNVNGPC